jgi:hypothetical protein
MTITGHDHLYDHWVERYQGADGQQRRMDHVVTGGGGAPLYAYLGEPSLREYRLTSAAGRIMLVHLAKPGPNPGDNPYHFVLFQVDGDRIQLQVIGVDWGAGFQPYRSNGVDLGGGGATRAPAGGARR